MARKTLVRIAPPLFPEHPASEHQWRVDRARAIMKEMEIDALVLSRNVNVFYATGSRFVFVGMDAPMANRPQSTAIITADADIYCQRFGPFDTDDTPLQTASSAMIELYDDDAELVNILADYGIGRGARVATEWGSGLTTGINPIKFLQIKQAIEEKLGAEIIDATPAIARLTGIKSEMEVERMRVAVDAAARAMERLFDYIKIGMTEVDVSRQVSMFMLEEGAQAVNHAQVMSEGEGRISLGSCDATDRPIQRGWVHLDIGCKYRRYTSDINRGIFLGREPDKDEAKLYACRVGVNEVLDRLIRPGVSVDWVLEEMKKYVESQGCVVQERAGKIFGGHGLGMEPYQHPGLLPSELQPEFQNADGVMLIEKGMMFTYEMAIRLPGSDAFFNIEDDVVVTADGVENMNASLSRELRVK